MNEQEFKSEFKKLCEEYKHSSEQEVRKERKKMYEEIANDLAMIKDSLIDSGFTEEFVENLILYTIGGKIDVRNYENQDFSYIKSIC